MTRPRLWAALLFALAARSPGPVSSAAFHVDFDGTTGPARAALELPPPPAVPALRALSVASKTGLDALAQRLASDHPEIPQEAVRKAFAYLREHPDSIGNSRYVAVLDLDRPSDERRLSVIRLRDGRVESYRAAHGVGSGDRYATAFSDKPRSYMSALGLYLTAGEYRGEHGRSMKLRGMDGTNKNAAARRIVLHGAAYVSDRYVAAHGMAGQSWGCPAVDFKDRDRIIDQLEGGAVLLLHRSGF